ncbi:MAG: hypothetical protein WC107_02585 [Patescibacteria group bacterium]
MKQDISKKNGFGIIEVLVAATIIIVILAALTSVGKAALTNNSSLQERSNAIYLAQEGLEIVRQIRDSNWIDDQGNNAVGIDGQSRNSEWHDLTFDENRKMLREVTISNTGVVNPNLSHCYAIGFINDGLATNRFALINEGLCELYDKKEIVDLNIIGQQSKKISFNRHIRIEATGGLIPSLPNGTNQLFDVHTEQNALKITSIVEWKNRKVETSEILTNWRPNY